MSSDHETDSEVSYQTDDSDINFIPGYVMECTERENSSPSDQKESNMGVYADEPMSDDEWLENCNRKERERLELQEKLRKRLDGSVEVSEW